MKEQFKKYAGRLSLALGTVATAFSLSACDNPISTLGGGVAGAGIADAVSDAPYAGETGAVIGLLVGAALAQGCRYAPAPDFSQVPFRSNIDGAYLNCPQRKKNATEIEELRQSREWSIVTVDNYRGASYQSQSRFARGYTTHGRGGPLMQTFNRDKLNFPDQIGPSEPIARMPEKLLTFGLNS